LNRHFEKETPYYQNEHRVLCKDGTYKWILDRGKVMEWNIDGKPLRVIGTHKDISEQKKSEVALRESEKKYRALLEGSILGILAFDIETHQCSFSNSAACKLFGYSEEEICRLNLADFHPKDSVETVISEFESQMRGKKSISDTLPCLRKDGTIFYADIAGYSTIINERSCNIGFIMDVTARKQSEDSLLQIRLFLDSIIDQSPNSMWISDEHGNVIRVNQACKNFFKLKDEEVIGKYNIFKDNIVEEQGFMPMVRDVFENGTTARFTIHYDTSAVKILELGRTTQSFLEVYISPILNSHGKVTNTIIQHIDITEQKQIEGKIKRSEAQLANALDIAKLGPWEYDVASDTFTFNDHFYKVFRTTVEREGGYTMTSAQYARRFVHADDMLQVGIETRKAIETTDPNFSRNIEHRIIYADGKTGYINVHFFIIKDAQGRTVKTYGVNQDITERKQIQESLRVSEQRYHNLFDQANEGLILLSKDGKLAEVNKSFAEMHGYTVDEMKHLDIRDLDVLRERSFKDRDDIMHRLEAGEVVHFEVDHYHKDGHVITFSNSASLITIGDQQYYLAFHQDITERKVAEQKLREKDIQFRKLSSNLPDLIYQFTRRADGSYCVPIASEGIKNIFGCSPEDVIEDFSPIGRVIFPEDSERVISDIEYSAEHLTYFTCEFRVQIPNKPIQWIFSRSTPEKLADGSVTWYGFNANITEMKQTEFDLTRAKEKAEESDRLKSAFLANMSHEIRTPMNGILGFTELLKEPELTVDEQRSYIHIIEKSGTRLLNIINDIVDMSKIEAGQMDITLSEVNVNAKIEFIYDFFKPEAEQKKIHFLFYHQLPTTEAVIRTDPEKIYAILTNLVKNALKFTQEGSLEFGYVKKGEILEFYVKDTGIGIRPEYKEIIFKRFMQGDKLLTKNYEGTGLGLSISKAYVEMLGGTMWMESEVGKGSTFYFTIPYNVETEKNAFKDDLFSVSAAEHQVKNLKILIAEDDETSATLITTVVKKISHDLLHAVTGIEAVDACRNNPGIDLVLMDITMPELSGYEATRQIRTFNKDVIIIAQTAYAQTGDREKSLEAGCNDYISKPLKHSLLLELIHKYFNK
jgi:PAS domain S-box-containing protein